MESKHNYYDIFHFTNNSTYSTSICLSLIQFHLVKINMQNKPLDDAFVRTWRGNRGTDHAIAFHVKTTQSR